MSTEVVRVAVTGVEQTAAVGAALAARLAAGDVVLLAGELAAGKTTLVRAVAEALGVTDPVTSPTFSIAQFYAAPTGRVLHVDAYRLESVAEFRDLGLDEFAEDCVTLVEWGDLVAEQFPGHLRVQLDAVEGEPDARVVEVRGDGERWAGALDGVRNAFERVGR